MQHLLGSPCPAVTSAILQLSLLFRQARVMHVQGAASEALQAFFAALVSLGVKEASAPKLIDAIVGSAKSESHAAKQAAAQCIAALAVAEGASQVRFTAAAMVPLCGPCKLVITHSYCLS